MNLQNKKNHKKTIIITAAVLLTTVGTAFLYVYTFDGSLFGWEKQKTAKVNDVNYGKSTKEQQEAGSDIENKNSSDDPNQVGSDRAPQPTSNDDTKANTPVTITASGQNGNVVQIRTLISALTGTGTCTLSFTNKATTVTKSAKVQSLPSSSTCKGFDVPVSELSVGTWQYTLTFENETMKGAASGSVTVQQVTQ